MAKQQICSDKPRQPSGVFSHATTIEAKGWSGSSPARGGGGDRSEPEGQMMLAPSTMRFLMAGPFLCKARGAGEGIFDRGLAPNPDRSHL
jgi:hypothetical protein